MSEPWIKMRTGLSSSPKVVRISIATGAHQSAVCGACFFVWSLADQHSVSGKLSGYTYEVLDSLVNIPGFCKAAEAVGWIAQTPMGVELPNFGRHNGHTAKRRAQSARRASRSRSAVSATQTPHMRHTSATKCAPRLDEMRLEKTTASAGKSDAAVAGLSADEAKARGAFLRRRPDWLPESKPWIDDDAASELAAMPTLTPEIVTSVYGATKRAKATLTNPAGYAIKKMREAAKGNK